MGEIVNEIFYVERPERNSTWYTINWKFVFNSLLNMHIFYCCESDWSNARLNLVCSNFKVILSSLSQNDISRYHSVCTEERMNSFHLFLNFSCSHKEVVEVWLRQDFCIIDKAHSQRGSLLTFLLSNKNRTFKEKRFCSATQHACTYSIIPESTCHTFVLNYACLLLNSIFSMCISMASLKFVQYWVWGLKNLETWQKIAVKIISAFGG